MQEELEKIWAKYDETIILPDELQNDALRKYLAELENFSEDKRNANLYYSKGFFQYMLTPSEVSDAQISFQKALEIYPAHDGARLYLGHCLYDTGFYKDAEYHFSIVDKEEFNEFFQMKIEEILVCCHIRTSDLDEVSLLEAKSVINKFFKLNYLDDYLFSLSKTLKEFNIDLDELAIKNLKFRQAKREDLPELVRMLADDFLGTKRERYENPLPESYVKAFEEIEADKNNELIVAENDGEIIGMLQITFTPSISFQGSKRATVESVRVDKKYRGCGIGKELMRWAIERARGENCHILQLTTDGERKDAHRFYENLGFAGTHLGMKLKLK